MTRPAKVTSTAAVARKRRAARARRGDALVLATSPSTCLASKAPRRMRPREAKLPSAARLRQRHVGLILSLCLLVLAPLAVVAWYLEHRASDQYASHVAFSVRQESAVSAFDLRGGISQMLGGGAGSSDSDILNEFIQSQDMVTRVNARLDLREIYARPQGDPVFAFDPAGSIEDLLHYWRRMVRITYDPGTGLIELQARAFDPDEAQAIATAILEESSALINTLSAIARDDTLGFAREELAEAQARLRNARESLTAFRSRTRIVDPSADIQGQMGLLNTLQQELASALIEQDLLRENTRDSDPRIIQTGRRIEVINRRISEERQKFSIGGANAEGRDFATLMAEYERLSVDLEFAEQAYRNALAAYDATAAEARRQSRYLAPYIRPTLAERAEYPRRYQLFGLAALFLFLGWGAMGLIYYGIRDRR